MHGKISIWSVFLGYILEDGMVQADPDRLEAFSRIKSPKNKVGSWNLIDLSRTFQMWQQFFTIF
jgi:hypothetical protein